MTRQESIYQSLAACGAFHIAFTGLVHEVMGPTLFPFLPAVFGFFLWHATGFAFIAVGLLLLGGVLRVIRFPIVPGAMLTSAGAGGAMIWILLDYRMFHFFAFSVVIAGFCTAGFYRKAERMRSSSAA